VTLEQTGDFWLELAHFCASAALSLRVHLTHRVWCPSRQPRSSPSSMALLYILAVTSGLGWILAAYSFSWIVIAVSTIAPWVLLILVLHHFARFPPFYTYRLTHARKGGRLAAPHLLKGVRIHALWAKTMNDPMTDLGLVYDDVEVLCSQSGGVDRLRGWHVPAAKATAPTCIVCVHGAGRDRRNFLRHTPHLHEAGHGVLLCDFGEHGISDGRGWGINYGQRESYEVADMVRYARQELGYEYVVVIGTSMGAASAIIAAGVHSRNDDSARIDGLVAENPFESRLACLRSFGDKLQVHPAIPFGRVADAALKEAVLRATFFLLRRSDPVMPPGEPKDVIEAISPRPVLLLHGTDDALLAIEHSHNLHAAAKAPKDLWIAEGAVHTAIYDAHPEEWQRRFVYLAVLPSTASSCILTSNFCLFFVVQV